MALCPVNKLPPMVLYDDNINIKKTTCRAMWIKLDDIDDIDVSTLMALEGKRNIKHMGLGRDGYLLLKSDHDHYLTLNRGMLTIQRWLGLNMMPKRVNHGGVLPNTFLKRYYNDATGDIDPSNFTASFGEIFKQKYLASLCETIVTTNKNKARNAKIESMDTNALVRDGTIAYEKKGLIRALKEQDEQEAMETNLHPDLPLDEIIEYTFEEWQTDPVLNRSVQTNKYPKKTVRIISECGQGTKSRCRRKHYWLQSSLGGFGKSYFMDTMVEKYNAFRITDIKNVMDVPKNAQFLLLDETGALPSIDTLKNLTGGNASAAAFNRKTHGRSFKTRPDAQVIVCANQSHFEFYGRFDAKLQRRFITDNHANQLQDRFTYIKLDGDEKEELDKFRHPSSFTYDEILTKIEGVLTEPWQSRQLDKDGEKIVMLQHIKEIIKLVKSYNKITSLPPSLGTVTKLVEGWRSPINSFSYEKLVQGTYTVELQLQRNRTPLDRLDLTYCSECRTAKFVSDGFWLEDDEAGAAGTTLSPPKRRRIDDDSDNSDFEQ